MSEKKQQQGREIAFVETYNEDVKKTIERAFLRRGVSYLIKVDKVAKIKQGLFGSKIKYTFQINRYQQEEAKAAVEEKNLDENTIRFLT